MTSQATNLQKRMSVVKNSADSETKPRKRKANEALPTTEAKIQKTEDSIKKLKEHLEKKTQLSPSRVS